LIVIVLTSSQNCNLKVFDRLKISSGLQAKPTSGMDQTAGYGLQGAKERAAIQSFG
jgi:ribosomal protein L15